MVSFKASPNFLFYSFTFGVLKLALALAQTLAESSPFQLWEQLKAWNFLLSNFQWLLRGEVESRLIIPGQAESFSAPGAIQKFISNKSLIFTAHWVIPSPRKNAFQEEEPELTDFLQGLPT